MLVMHITNHRKPLLNMPNKHAKLSTEKNKILNVIFKRAGKEER